MHNMLHARMPYQLPPSLDAGSGGRLIQYKDSSKGFEDTRYGPFSDGEGGRIIKLVKFTGSD